MDLMMAGMVLDSSRPIFSFFPSSDDAIIIIYVDVEVVDRIGRGVQIEVTKKVY